MVIKYIIVLFVETPRKFITTKLSIRKPGSSSVLIALMKIRAYGSYYIGKKMLNQNRLRVPNGILLVPGVQYSKNLITQFY